MMDTQTTFNYGVGVALMNPFDGLPKKINLQPYQRKYLRLTKQLGVRGVTSFNIDDTHKLIKQIWEHEIGRGYGRNKSEYA
jgi:hypothetical protein